jgi:hypothetical protein
MIEDWPSNDWVSSMCSFLASLQRPGGSGVSDPSYRKSASETTTQAAKPPL